MRLTRARLWLAVALSSLAGVAAAQQTPEIIGGETGQAQIARTVLTVDIERVFAQSQFGQRIAAELTAAGEELSLENTRIAAELREEELALAARRPEMEIDVFLREAEAFDLRAQEIRRTQDAKEAALEEAFNNGRAQFLTVTRPILGELMEVNGAVAIFDRRSVLLFLPQIDITNEAILRIDAALGDGAETPELEPVNPTDE